MRKDDCAYSDFEYYLRGSDVLDVLVEKYPNATKNYPPIANAALNIENSIRALKQIFRELDNEENRGENE